MISRNLLKTLGPGILFASTAIGVSHLVQSTKAGAGYGFMLIWAVLLANLFKYPFFEFGSRYANVTGKSLIDGYKELGTWMLFTYLLITIGTMFFVVAAVSAVTAGFMDNLFGIGDLRTTTIVLFILSVAILITGRYKTLDSLIKIIGTVLLLSTVIAFVLTLAKGPVSSEPLFGAFSFGNAKDVAFVVALMGWMPTAVDLSTWNSLWTVERIKQTGYRPSLRETLFDFNFGYLMSAFLSICFVTLGAYMFFGTGKELANGAADFSDQVVRIFSGNIGAWSYYVIAVASFSIMFGTCIAVFDGFARATERTAELLFLDDLGAEQALKDTRYYNIAIVVIAVIAYALIHNFLFTSEDKSGFGKLVDIATTLSFLVAPFVAMANYRLVTNPSFPDVGRPKPWLRVLAILGILFLSGFSLFFLWNSGWLSTLTVISHHGYC